MNRFTSFILLTLPLIPSLGSAHPLQKALEGLSKVAGEVRIIKTSDPSSQAATLELSEQIDKAWLTALFLPLEFAKQRSESLGVTVAEDKVQRGYFRRQSNENFKALKSDAYNLKPDSWLALQKMTEDQIRWIEKFNDLLKQNSVTQNISDVAFTQARINADFTRATELENLLEFTKKTLKCIDNTSNFFKTVGIRVVGPEENLKWSLEDLRSKYGVSSATDLTASHKQNLVKKLDELTNSFIYVSGFCVSRAKRVFLTKEFYQLKGESL